MNQFEMIAIIVFVAIAGGVIRTALRYRVAAPPQPDPQQDKRIAALEERVRALEAVVTDHGYDLKKQFKDLERTP